MTPTDDDRRGRLARPRCLAASARCLWWSLRAVLALAGALGLAGCSVLEGGPSAAGSGEAAATAEGPVSEAPAGLAYEVAIEGVDDEALRELLKSVTESERLIERPPPSLARLRRRARNDVPRLQEALRSEGYYGGEVATAIDADAEPIRVLFGVDLGPRYRLREVAVEVEPPTPGLKLPDLAELGIAPGQPAAAKTIIDAEATLLARALAQGYALAKIGKRRALIEHRAAALDLTLRLEPGPRARFGPTEVTGLTEVQADFVRGRLPWRPGDLMTSELLERGREDLADTGLFASIGIRPAKEPDTEGQLPVTVELKERKHRSISAGARFRTDEGPGGDVSWEHRNFFGRGERVKATFDASGIGASLDGTFRKPDVAIVDLALLAEGRLAYEDTDAFESESATARIGLEYELARLPHPQHKTLTGGLSYRFSHVDEANSDDDDLFGLVSLPIRFDWDRSDDRLDPSKGGRLGVQNEPFVDTLGNDLQFNKTELSYSHYLRVLDEPRVVLAGRTAVGTMFGASRADIPADLRFYAGGGGSVRGFTFQKAGPLDDKHDPLGGRSLLELSAEVRTRVTPEIGLVVFVDAGTVYASRFPDFSEPLRVGAGPGVRYISPVGPVRLDVAFPLNPRDSDDAFQFYISLGQAF